MATEKRAGIAEGAESARNAAGQLLKLLSPASPVRLAIPQVRYLGRTFAAFRWGAGIAMVALVGLLLPPRHPFWLALLVLWVAAYNGPITVALNRADNESIRIIVRIGAIIDMVSYFGLLAIFVGSTPGVLIAIYPSILIESITFDGAIGAIYGVVIFLIGFAGLELAQQRFSTVDLILWGAAMAIIASSMTIASQVMLGSGVSDVPKPDPALPGGRLPGAAGAPRLSAREHEVLRLLAEGYSNAMIASRLHLSENTVKGHVEAVLSRLNARNRAEAVAAAGRLDLL